MHWTGSERMSESVIQSLSESVGEGRWSICWLRRGLASGWLVIEWLIDWMGWWLIGQSNGWFDWLPCWL